MCRFLVYRGREMFLSDLITRSTQSLIRQSYHAREREEPLNGDGFGVGWYSPEIDPTPCVFNGVRPAWSDRNLSRLADKIRSTCVFAHVRAASRGTAVSELNCHPFEYDRFLWMHNGGIADFARSRRRLREGLSDEAYNSIQGSTDSEHAFAYFLDQLLPRIDRYTSDDLVSAMMATIAQLNALTREAGATRPSRYNFAVTDGQTIIATRYVDDPETAPHSLYVSAGQVFENIDGQYRMRPTQRQAGAVIIASEPLTDERSDWTEVPRNHLVEVTPELHLRTLPID